MKSSLRSLSSFPEFNIGSVQFKVLSSDEIRKRAVCEITNKKSEGENFISDPRLGPCDEKTSCVTCGRNFHECPGHEGFIELPVPIINPEMRVIVLSLLSCVCSHCSSLLVDKTIFSDKCFMSKKGLDKLKFLKKAAEINGRCLRVLKEGERPCPPSPIYKKNDNNDGSHMIKYTYRKNKNIPGEQIKNYRTSQEIYDILDHISDEDAAFLGFDSKGSHPRDFIMKCVLVSPTCTRPYLFQDGEKLSDFMTNSYTTILSIKEKMKDSNLSENAKKDNEKKLNLAISSMISTTGEINTAKAGSSKSIRQKLGGKKGLVREKAMGKRIDHAGRSVIGGESSMPFGYLAVPKYLASVLTKKIIVTNYNLHYAKKLYNEGLVQYTTPASGRFQGENMKVIITNKEKLIPRVGDKLEVSLVNGDIATFNRQPTLHKGCMMSHRVIINDQNNIRIHSSITNATNADFDGDDANVYIPQEDETIMESIMLGGIPSCISDFNTSEILLSLYYNACLGMYLLSDPSVILDKEDWEEGLKIFQRDMRKSKNAIGNNRVNTIHDRIKQSGIHKRSGKALISCLFPPDMYLNNGKILIENGILIKGRLEKSTMGGFGIIKYILEYYGQYFTTNFISESQWLYDWYLSIRGFSVSMSDIIPKNEEKVKDYINNQLIRAQRMVDDINKSNDSEFLKETKILSCLSKIDDGGKKMVEETMSDDNSYVIMVKSGAKGSTNNIKCMTAMYGQELNNGMRPKFSMSNKQRVTCLGDFNDQNVVNRGFIVDNFLKGLSPQSLIIHMDGSRDGIIASIIATPDSGNLNRKMNNFMNSTRIGSCGEVEITKNNILQLSFGDGFDISKTILNKSLKRGTEKYFIDLQNCADRLMAPYLKK